MTGCCRLIISARDNPGNPGDSRTTTAELVINVLTDEDLLVLTVKNTTPEELEGKTGRLAEIMRDGTGLLVDIRQVVPALQETENGTCCQENPSASDVWFYAIEPASQKLLSVNSSKVETLILSRNPQTNLRYTITGELHVQASQIKAPHLAVPTSAVPPLTGADHRNERHTKALHAASQLVPCHLLQRQTTENCY